MWSTNEGAPAPSPVRQDHAPARRVVLFTPLGLNLAEVTRMIEVARALIELQLPGPGRLCPVFLVHDEGFDHLVDQAGFERVPGARSFTPEQARQLMAFDQGRALRHPFTRQVIAERVRIERAAIQDLGAVAVVHGTNPTSPISARAEQVPLFYPVPYVFSAAHLAAGRGIPLLPERGWGAVANRVLRGPAAWVMGSAPLVPPSFRSVAHGNGVRVRSLMDLLGADVTLLTSMAEEIGADPLPPRSHRVGPIFARLDGEVPEQVRELAAGDQPLVYLACGSSGNPRLVLDAMRALGRAPVQVIAPVRQYLDAAQIASTPSNVHVTELLPAHLMGGLVDAAVLHGGQGTVQTACATGVPFIGMGLSAEQRWNVDVWARRGNAIALAPSDLRGDAVRFHRALRALLTDPGIRRAADAVAGEHRGEDGARRSAEIIGDLVG